jgi:hypothetical protein
LIEAVEAAPPFVGGGFFGAPETQAPASATKPATPTKPVDPDPEAKDASAALNGAQVTALHEMILAVGTGELNKATAAKLITAAFPLSETEAAGLLSDVVEGANKAPGGAADEDPFLKSASGPSTSPTSAPSTNPRASALSRALAEPAPSRSSES